MSKQQNKHHHHLHPKNTFLPMLCSGSSITLSRRSASFTGDDSVKDSTCEFGRIPIRLEKTRGGIKGDSLNDPSLPRVGCMGQVKKNNRVSGFPTYPIKIGDFHSCRNSNVKYHKLKRFFSSKSLTASPTAAAAGGVGSQGGGHSSRGKTRGVKERESSRCNGIKCDVGLVNVAELDPPLPVVRREKRRQNGGGEAVSLWKRRSGGAPLQSLQVKQIHGCALQARTV